MVVDDEPALCRILERIISGEGYKVIVAMDGEKALALFKEHNPEVVLLDLMLPGMNGQEICRRIKELSPVTKVIFLSAKATPKGTAELRELKSEADGYLPKPASSRQILSSIQKVLGNK